MNATEYSRLVFKRSTVAGIVPTIPTGTTIDSSWLPTDILIGESFINVTDDRFWFRTNNGIVEVDLSGQTLNSITTGATLVGNTIYFETINSPSAYTVDLSSIIVTGGTPTLSQVLASGNTTGGNNIIVTSGDSITSSSGTGSISLDSSKVTLNKAKINSVAFGFNDYVLGSSSGDDVKYSYTHMYNGLAILTSSYTINLTDKYGHYLPDTTSNPVTINLPAINTGFELTILDFNGNAATNNITINAASGDTINGVSNFVINTDYGGVKIVSVSANSWTISSTNITSGGGIGASIWTAATYGANAIRTNNGSTTDTSNSSGDADYAIAAGYNILVEGDYSLGIGGSNNYAGGQASAIVAGQDNITENATARTFILAGQNNIVKDSASNSGIIGGNNNSFQFLNSIVNSVIVGGNNIEAKESNTVYVPALNIGTTTGTPTSNVFLTLNSANAVVTANTSTSLFNYYTENTTIGTATIDSPTGATIIVSGGSKISTTEYGNNLLISKVGNLSNNYFQNQITDISNQLFLFDNSISTVAVSYDSTNTAGVGKTTISATDGATNNRQDTLNLEPGGYSYLTSVDTATSNYSEISITPTSLDLSADIANSAPGLSLSSDFVGIGLGAIISATPDLQTISISDTQSSIGFYANNSSNKGIELTSTSGIYLVANDIYVNSANATGTPVVNLAINSVGKIVTASTPCDISFAVSDETTAITSGTSKLTFYAPYAFTIANIYASLSTSGSTSSIFDVNKNDVTVFSTRVSIDANEFHSKDATTQPVITGTSISQFDKIVVDIDSAGTGAKGAKIYIVGTRTI